MTDWHYLFGLNGPQGRSYNADVNTRFKQRPLRMTASGHLRWSLLFQENCSSAGGTRSEGRFESYKSQPMFKKLPSSTVLHETAEQFHILVDSVEEYAIYLLDPNGNVITWNTGAAKIKGYSTEEIIGKN